MYHNQYQDIPVCECTAVAIAADSDATGTAFLAGVVVSVGAMR